MLANPVGDCSFDCFGKAAPKGRYGKVHPMRANLLFKSKFVYEDGAIREMAIWELPETDPERPHGLKYRLFYGYPWQSLVRYDNERGKGDHRHYLGDENDYDWKGLEQLLSDFEADINHIRGKKNE